MAFVSFLVHAILSNVFAKNTELLKHNRHSLAGLLLLCCNQKRLEEEEGVQNEEKSEYEITSLMIVRLKSQVRATADSVGRERRI